MNDIQFDALMAVLFFGSVVMLFALFIYAVMVFLRAVIWLRCGYGWVRSVQKAMEDLP